MKSKSAYPRCLQCQQFSKHRCFLNPIVRKGTCGACKHFTSLLGVKR